MARSRSGVRMLCEGALLIAAALILDLLPVWEMPWGGCISLGMVPFFLFACRWGMGAGLLGGFVLGVLEFLFDGGFALTVYSLLGDYLAAFTVLGSAGVFRGRRWSIFAGTILGCALRFLVHYAVGATVWASLMPETFFGMTMTTPWIYSLLYNGFYMGIDLVLCLVVFILLSKPMGKYVTGADLR